MISTEPLKDEFLVDNLELVKVIAHSIRLNILQSLKIPKPVKKIAKTLNLPATKLYYHINLMEKHGLIQVVETNIVSGIVEKKYQVVARNYRIDNRLLTDELTGTEDFARMIGAIFDTTRAEIQRMAQQTRQNPLNNPDDEAAGILWRSTLRLTQEQYVEFYQRLKLLLEEMASLNREEEYEVTAVSNQNLYGITIAYYPIHPLAEEEK
jgi:predicted ArsR family transcriptional regulator